MGIHNSLPSQEGSGLKRIDFRNPDKSNWSSLARGKWIEAPFSLSFPLLFTSSLARGKWIEAYLFQFLKMNHHVFPRKREVD